MPKVEYNQIELNELLRDTVKAGDSKGAIAALEAGANPDITLPVGWSTSQEGATLIQYACWHGPDALDVVKALIAKGANLEGALWQAAVGSARYDNYQKDAKPLIDALVDAGADPNEALPNGTSILFGCVNDYDAKISLSATKALLARGANPNARSTVHGYVLSHFVWSAQQGDPSGVAAVKKLVEAGANVNPEIEKREFHCQGPLGAAVQGSGVHALELVDYLLSKGADAGVVDTRGKTLSATAKNPMIKAKLAPNRPEPLEPQADGTDNSRKGGPR